MTLKLRNMTRRLFIVDAFTERPYWGNSAGVVLEADGLSDAQMQAIAREVNASETAFVLSSTQRESAFGLRWFTPTTEVAFCGHATVGAVHAVIESKRFPSATDAPAVVFPIETRHRGILTTRTERSPAGLAPRVWFDAPDLNIQPAEVPLDEVAALLGIEAARMDARFAPIRTSDVDIFVAVDTQATLAALRPSMADVEAFSQRHGLRGLLVTTLGPDDAGVRTCSRFFAPAAGVPEDPVTGSAHGPLALHLVRSGHVPLEGDRVEFRCMQFKAGDRGGTVHVGVVRRSSGEWHVRVGGSAVTTFRGELAAWPA